MSHPSAILSNILTASQKETLHMLNGDLVRTGKKLCLHSQFQGRNLNLGPPEHEVGVPISIVCYIWR